MCLSRKPPTVGPATFLPRKLIEQRLGLLQNGRIAALNEPAEHCRLGRLGCLSRLMLMLPSGNSSTATRPQIWKSAPSWFAVAIGRWTNETTALVGLPRLPAL